MNILEGAESNKEEPSTFNNKQIIMKNLIFLLLMKNVNFNFNGRHYK